MQEIGLTVIGLIVMIVVGLWAHYSLKPEAPAKIAGRQLEEARRKALEHYAAMEAHKAQSDMYTLRIKRLEKQA